jgi:Asp-tRNA(Asn)/Glu-tRNA(Gln) amidotransferase A subunit family amidase
LRPSLWLERGILAGAPYARKDLFKRRGYGAENGSPLFRGQIADTTSTVIERLDLAAVASISAAWQWQSLP